LGSTLNFVAKQDMFIIQISGFDKNFIPTLSLVGVFHEKYQGRSQEIEESG